MEVSEIVGRERPREWLQDKPKEWAQAIAARVALRVAPIAWSAAVESHLQLSDDDRKNLILVTFRASFISSAARQYPADDMRTSAAAAAHASASANAANAAAAYASASAAAHASAADHASASANAANAAAFAADAAAAADIWESIRLDCKWLEETNAHEPENVPFEKLSKDEAIARELMRQPLWMQMGMPDTLPDWAKKEFAAFNHSDLAKTTSFGLLTDWYRAILRGGLSPFDEKAEIAIAQMSPKDWGDGDDPRDCIAVMHRVAKIAGWERSDDGLSEDQESAIQTNFVSSFDDNMEVGRASSASISHNRIAVRVQLTSLLNSVKFERDALGAKPNDPETLKDWEKQTEFLDKMEDKISAIVELLPIKPDGAIEEGDEEASKLLSDFGEEFELWLRTNKRKLVDWAMRLGSATVFIGLMSALGATMPVATSVVLAMTCGSKARDILMTKKTKDE